MPKNRQPSTIPAKNPTHPTNTLLLNIELLI